MIDFAAARVLYADHIAENPEISPLMLQQPPTGRSVLDFLASEFSFYFTWSTLRLQYLTRLRLRPTRRVFVWMDGSIPRRSEGEPFGECCSADAQNEQTL